MADGLDTSISPVAPGSSTAPVSGSAIRRCTPGAARPALSSRHRSGVCTGLAAMTGTSLVPYAGSQRTPERRVTVRATSSATGVAPHMM